MMVIERAAPAGRAGGDRREERRGAILDAAEILFVEQGFERTSLAAIVKRSGGSLATVYEMFGNKHGLLRAVIDRSVAQLLDVDHFTAESGLTPAEQLRSFAIKLHLHMIDPRTIALSRILVIESLSDPDFARAVHEQLYGERSRELAECFREWTAQGRAAFDDAHAAVDLYFTTVLGDVHHDAMLGLVASTDVAEITRAIDWRLAPFLAWFKLV